MAMQSINAMFTHIVDTADDSDDSSVDQCAEEKEEALGVDDNSVNGSQIAEMSPRPSLILKREPTYVSLLEEGYQRAYSSSPVYTSVDKYLTEATAEATTKRTAKHLASKMVLLQIVQAGCWQDFGIPGANKAEAEKFLRTLMPELEGEDSKSNGPSVDWVSKCAGICQKNRLGPQPQYNFMEEGAPNSKLFTCTASLNELEVVGRKCRTKKEAKNAAAEILFSSICANKPLQGGIEEAVEGVTAATPSNNNFGDSLPMVLKEWLDKGAKGSENMAQKLIAEGKGNADLLKFISEIPELLYTPLPQLSTGGYQVYLDLISHHYSKGRQQSTFGGLGADEQEAKDDAAFQALRHIYHCVDWGAKSPS